MAADMRLECFDSQWAGFAFYALIIGLIYVAGLPIAVFVILFRRRHKLFGDATNAYVSKTRETYGFLYEVGTLLFVPQCTLFCRLSLSLSLSFPTSML